MGADGAHLGGLGAFVDMAAIETQPLLFGCGGKERLVFDSVGIAQKTLAVRFFNFGNHRK